MELRKRHESVTRSYDAEGTASDRVDAINYEVCDAEGNVIGSAHVNSSDAELQVRVYGISSVEEGEARLKEALGIAE